MDQGQYLTVAYDPTWEQDAAKITDDQRGFDDLQRAAELMAQRGLANSVAIPTIPNTDVYVFRLDPGPRGIPATRWFFRVEGEKATFLAVLPIPEDDSSDHLQLDGNT